MSFQLDWQGLEQSFADSLCERLNAFLSGATLPSFLGPTRVHALELGSEAPDIQVIHVGDVWREFREAEAQASVHAQAQEKCTRSSTPPPRLPMRLRTFRHYENDEMPLSVQGSGDGDSVLTDIDDASSHRWSDVDSDVGTSDMSCTWEESAREQSIPSMQLHFSVQWLTSTMRLSLTSSLQIAYHDDTVMSLPISLIITGLELYAQAIVAVDGVSNCIHVSLTEDSTEPCSADGLRQVYDARIRVRHQGQRILPYLGVESQIGEPVKHVLENVGKVERFVGDMLRQWLEDELVYPHFYTFYL